MIQPFPTGWWFNAVSSASRTVTTLSSQFEIPPGSRFFISQLVCSVAGAAGSIRHRTRMYGEDGQYTYGAEDATGLVAVTGNRYIGRSDTATEPSASAGALHSVGHLFGRRIQIEIVHATADPYTYYVNLAFFS